MSASSMFSALDLETLSTVTGGQSTGECPDAADAMGKKVEQGVAQGAARIDAAVEAGKKGDVGGVLGNGLGAFIDAAGVAKDILSPSTPTC